ncbi:putative iron-sulfur cluster insertion protein ErpA [Bienertia sinuspersici]
MAQLLNLSLPSKTPLRISSPSSSPSYHHNFATLAHQFRCNGRFSCLFSDNRKQDQARKALESALGGNEGKFEKWNQEIKKREEVGGGGNGGGGGWFGWGGRFGWNNDDNFWQEAQQASLAVLGILVLYLVAAKGEQLLAVIINPLLFALRSTRNSLTYVMSLITGKSYLGSNARFEEMKLEAVQSSAKERVVKKWASD